MAYTLRFFLQNAVCIISITCLVPVLVPFYIGCAKIIIIISAPKVKRDAKELPVH